MSTSRPRSSWLVLSIAFAGGLGSAACSKTADISDGVCGNGVLDPGEDCDRSDGTCTTDCRVVCSPAATGTSEATCPQANALDGTCCPTGFTCGLDDVCHAPSGTLSTADIAQPFDAQEFVVADIDRDGIDDVMGVSSSAVLTRYGASSAPFTLLDTESAPFSNGGIGIDDLDGDGVPDIVIPTRGGLFTFETTTGVPQPVAYPVSSLPLVHVRSGAMPALGSGAAVLLDQQGSGSAATFAISVDDGSGTTHVPCGSASLIADGADVQGRSLHPYVDGIGSAAVIRTPFLVANDGLSICIDATSPPAAVAPFAAPAGLGTGSGIKAATDGETFFANILPASVCPALVFPFVDTGTGAEMTGVLPGSGSVGSCTVGDTVLKGAFAIPGIPLTTITVGAATALVMSTGVWTVKGALIQTQLTISTRDWRYAITADVNGDGLDDFITVGTNTDVEVIEQVAGLGTQWNDLRIPTDGTIGLVVEGDYDGDGAGDIVMSTLDVTDATTQLSVAWGAVGPFSTPAPIGQFAEFGGVTTAALTDESDEPGFDQQDDLVIINGGLEQTDANDPGRVTYLYGTSAREFQAPWIHTITRAGSAANLTADGAATVVGHFGSGGSLGVLAAFEAGPTDDEFADLVSATHLPDDDLALDASVPFRLGSAADEQLVCRESDGLSSIGLGSGSGLATGGTTFCPNQARFVKLSTGSASELVLALREGAGSSTDGDCAAYVDSSGAAGSDLTAAFTACAALIGSGETIAATTLYNVDNAHALVDDNNPVGTERIVIDSTTPTVASYVWTMTGSSGAPTLSGGIDLSAEVAAFVGSASVVHCMDATTIELGTRDVDSVSYGADRELVTACFIQTSAAGVTPVTNDTQVFARFSSGDASTPPYYEKLLDIGQGVTLRLRAGDVNGDRIEDLVYVTGAIGEGTVHARLQCDTHGGACATTTSDSSSEGQS